MAKRSQIKETPHERAVSILELHIRENLGKSLPATAMCNECREELIINLVENVATVERNKSVGTVRPDLSMFDIDGNPIRFIEIADKHIPESNVHEYAVGNNIEVVEFHLNAPREFVGERRNRALDASLNVKARLDDLAAKRLNIDAHNLLCQRPKCIDCSTPLPLRTVAVSLKDCWNCEQNIKVATGYKDGQALEQDEFTKEELDFVRDSGVTLERRFSATVGAKYLANVCTSCDQIQGNWFLYQDPYHDRFNLPQAEKESYGPCDKCATRICLTHGEYFDYDGDRECPHCVAEAERVMCPNKPERECFYPNKCNEGGCYFVNRELV